MRLKTIIIGKDSNLSNHLLDKLNNATVVSSRDINSDVNILSKYKNQEVNLILNNFHPATKLNEMKNSEEFTRNCIGVTSKILNYCISNNIKMNKIIYTSTAAVYGDNKYAAETDELKPTSLHASFKVSNELMIKKFCTENKIDYTITRLFNMYGGNDKFSIISKILIAIKNNKKLTIINDGNAVRDFIHVEDVANIYAKLIDIKNIKFLNIGTGIGKSIKHIILTFKKYNADLITNNISLSEINVSTANIEILNKLIKKQSFIEIENFIKQELS
jgi:nucleoside-diphosphate-sugar epimerase